MKVITIIDTLIHKGGELETYTVKDGWYETALYAAEADSWYIIETTDTEEEAFACHKKWLDYLNNMNHIEYLNYLKSCFVYCPVEV